MKKIMTYINITDEMREQAKIESEKRNPHIKHHFEVNHLSYHKRDVVGFLGEFATCELLGINWKKNIRADYETIDSGDGKCKKGIFDVKTETIPYENLHKILNREIKDDELYGRRLIYEGQISLLEKYDIIIFGAFCRNNYKKWYPIGWLDTKYILANYRVTKKRPDGGEYPFSALAIKTSELKPISELLEDK